MKAGGDEVHDLSSFMDLRIHKKSGDDARPTATRSGAMVAHRRDLAIGSARWHHPTRPTVGTPTTPSFHHGDPMSMHPDFANAPYGITRRIEGRSFDDVVAGVRAVLPTVGFGVLTEIDVKATLHKKLGVDRLPYLILGACSPRHANAALEAVPSIGLFLPCNVVVAEDTDGAIILSAIDAEAMFASIGNPALEPIAAEVKALLARAIAEV